MSRVEPVLEKLAAACVLAIHAIDTVLPSSEGQAEHVELRAAFDALESALNTYDEWERT